MERLREFDPKGVEGYLQRRKEQDAKEQDALKKETKPKKRKHEQKER